MKIIYAPDLVPAYLDPNRILFLAGSIEMGAARNWQENIICDLHMERDLTILNPRRLNWNKDWTQSIDNPEFNQQVNWELDGIKRAGRVVFYFDVNTTSPITLMELGYAAGLRKQSIIYCPKGFWRRGNVEVMVDRNRDVFKMVESYEELVKSVRNK